MRSLPYIIGRLDSAELVQWSDFTPTSQKSDYFQVLVRKRSEFASIGRRNRFGGSRVEREGGMMVRSGIIQNMGIRYFQLCNL